MYSKIAHGQNLCKIYMHSLKGTSVSLSGKEYLGEVRTCEHYQALPTIFEVGKDKIELKSKMINEHTNCQGCGSGIRLAGRLHRIGTNIKSRTPPSLDPQPCQAFIGI